MSDAVALRVASVGAVLVRWWPVAVWLAVAVTVIIASERLNPYHLYLVEVVAAYSIAAIGLNVVSGYAGQMSFGHGALFGVGAYTFAILTVDHGFPQLVAVPAAGVAALILGVLLLGLPSLRVGAYYLALVTLGFGVVFSQWVTEWRGLTGGYLGKAGVPVVTLGPWDSPQEAALLLFGTVFVVYWFTNGIIRSKWGRLFVATKTSEVATLAVGAPVSRVKLAAFAYSSFLAGIGGAFFAGLLGYLHPSSFDVDLSIFLFLALVIGGMGSAIGPVIGTGALYLIPELYLRTLLEYRLLVYGALTIVAATALPGGIAGVQVPPRLRRLLVSRGRSWLGRFDRFPATVPGHSSGRPRPVAPVHLSNSPDSGAPEGIVLDVRGLTKRFGGLVANSGVSFQVRRGEILGLIGPNGSGKTTCLNIISGFLRADGGTTYLLGRPLGKLSPDRLARLGMARTFQTPKLIDSLTVLENVMLGRDWLGGGSFLGYMLRLPLTRRREERTRAEAEATLAFADDRLPLHAKVGDLPHGSRRLVEIARALLLHPDVLLLDEPAAGLSDIETERLHDCIRWVGEAGIAVVLIEHNYRFVADLASRVVVLNEGIILAQGEPEKIETNPEVVAAYLGEQ